jgi:hypothetical protein
MAIWASSSSGKFAGEGDRLAVAAVVAGHELGDLVVEQLRARQLGQAALDVARRRGGVAGEEVAEVALAFDQVALVGQHHQRVADRGVAVGMKLHRVADDVGHLDETAVVLLAQRPEDAALHRLEAVGQVGDGAVADDVGGVFEEAGVDATVEGELDLAGDERPVRVGEGGGQGFGHHFRAAVALGLARAVVVGGRGLGLRVGSPVRRRRIGHLQIHLR